MKKSRFTEEQIAYSLKQVELGTAVGEVCRKMGIVPTLHWHGKHLPNSPENTGPKRIYRRRKQVGFFTDRWPRKRGRVNIAVLAPTPIS